MRYNAIRIVLVYCPNGLMARMCLARHTDCIHSRHGHRTVCGYHPTTSHHPKQTRVTDAGVSVCSAEAADLDEPARGPAGDAAGRRQDVRHGHRAGTLRTGDAPLQRYGTSVAWGGL